MEPREGVFLGITGIQRRCVGHRGCRGSISPRGTRKRVRGSCAARRGARTGDGGRAFLQMHEHAILIS
jgi:hypothetical protein